MSDTLFSLLAIPYGFLGLAAVFAAGSFCYTRDCCTWLCAVALYAFATFLPLLLLFNGDVRYINRDSFSPFLIMATILFSIHIAVWFYHRNKHLKAAWKLYEMLKENGIDAIVVTGRERSYDAPERVLCVIPSNNKNDITSKVPSEFEGYKVLTEDKCKKRYSFLWDKLCK